MNINIYVFFPLSFRKCNKLEKYIYIYFFIISIIPLNFIFFIVLRLLLVSLKKRTSVKFFCYIVGVVEIDNHG